MLSSRYVSLEYVCLDNVEGTFIRSRRAYTPMKHERRSNMLCIPVTEPIKRLS
jgi:hypothetical protein